MVIPMLGPITFSVPTKAYYMIHLQRFLDGMQMGLVILLTMQQILGTLHPDKVFLLLPPMPVAPRLVLILI